MRYASYAGMLLFAAAGVFSFTAVGATEANDPAAYVNPFIGTQGDGNTFPGASLPFGMVKLGPDCGDLAANAGYRSDGPVHGFSHTHVSGTGGGCKYGNILVAPFYGEQPAADGLMRLSETASPGYFAMDFDGISAELTAARHAAVHRYTFTRPGAHGLMLEAASLLGADYCCGEEQRLIGAETEVLSPTEMQGYARVDGGWNMGRAFTVYFYAVASLPADRQHVLSPTAVSFIYEGSSGGEAVELRVGISYISTMQARRNCLDEVGGRDFATVAADARREWNGMLSRIAVVANDRDELVNFYTALYHAMLLPTDKSGENALWRSDAPYYDDFYCLWDTFRTLHPLLALIAPSREAAIVNSLVDIYRHEGYMPDGRSGDSNGRTQGGSNADMVVAEAIIKDLPGIDPDGALEAMLKDAEADPGQAARTHGRGGLADYKRLGYISTNYERGGVRTLEYSANDYAIALAAAKMGRQALADKYAARARNWRNLWRDVEYDGQRGFIMPRRADGSWDDEFRDPTWDYYTSTPPCRLDVEPYCDIADADRKPEPFTPWSAGSWVNFFYESNSWEYSLYVPHDVAGLIEACGGRDAFVSRLDHFFAQGHHNINNEPGFLTPCLYIYAGRHDRTVDIVGDLLSRYYANRPDGLPGNDDAGSMSSWYIFHVLGLFPVAGQDVYLLTAPRFAEATIDLSASARVGDNRQLVIRANGLSGRNRYVKSVTLNGRPVDRAWLTHAELMGGGELVFTMSPTAGAWPTGPLPPSQSPSPGSLRSPGA